MVSKGQRVNLAKVLTGKDGQNLIVFTEMVDDFLEPCAGICHSCCLTTSSRNSHSSKLSILMVPPIGVLEGKCVELQNVRGIVFVCIYAESDCVQRVVQ
jgi:hypothetical protein